MNPARQEIPTAPNSLPSGLAAGRIVNQYPGREPRYQLTCQCGTVELYPFPEGVTANRQRCPVCPGLAFGLRTKSDIPTTTRSA